MYAVIIILILYTGSYKSYLCPAYLFSMHHNIYSINLSWIKETRTEDSPKMEDSTQTEDSKIKEIIKDFRDHAKIPKPLLSENDVRTVEKGEYSTLIILFLIICGGIM